MKHGEIQAAQVSRDGLPPVWDGHQAPAPVPGTRNAAFAFPPARPRGPGRAWKGWLLSCCLHFCLLGGILAFAAYQVEKEEPVYRVALVALGDMSPAGTGAGLPGGTRGGAPDTAPVQAPGPPPAPAAEPAAGKNAVTHKSADAPHPVAPAKTRSPGKAAGKNKKRPTAPSQERMPSPAGPLTPQASGGQAATVPTGSAGTGTRHDTAASSAGTGGSGGSGLYMPGQLDHLPSVLRPVKPDYPPDAKKKRIEGRVVVRLIVDSTGRPTECAVHAAEPSGYFEEAALGAARKMRFIPGKKNGRPVRTLVLLPFAFRLR